MSPSYLFAKLALLVISLALPVTGVALLKRGWWPRLQGDQPHCRRCGYLLIGIQSERCPECGTTLSPSNIIPGQRRRQLGLACLGAAILLLGLALPATLIFSEIGDIQWYQSEPSFLVMRDLRAGTTRSADAIGELDRREKAGDLAAMYEQQIVEIALAQQATSASGIVADGLIQFLEQQLLIGHLTDAQKTRFGQQSLMLYLRVRPIVVLGDWIPFQIDESSRVSGPGFYVRVVYPGVGTAIDGKSVGPTGDESGSMSGLGSGGSSGNSVKCNQLGRHQLLVIPHVELRQGSFDAGTILFQEDRKLTASFEVVEKSAQDHFDLINDPSLSNPIKAAIVPTKFEWSAHAASTLSGDLQITNVPANIAFDIFARFNGLEYKWGTIACNKGTGTDNRIVNTVKLANTTTKPSSFDLILRSDERVGRETIDQHSIWNGELIYSGVPVAIP